MTEITLTRSWKNLLFDLESDRLDRILRRLTESLKILNDFRHKNIFFRELWLRPNIPDELTRKSWRTQRCIGCNFFFNLQESINGKVSSDVQWNLWNQDYQSNQYRVIVCVFSQGHFPLHTCSCGNILFSPFV